MLYLSRYLNNHLGEVRNYLNWQYDFKVVPSVPNWICELGPALAAPGGVRLSLNHLDDDQDYYYATMDDQLPDNEARGGGKVIEDFARFWKRKRCYGSYLDALRILTQ